jgi:hypothetical protein
MITVSFKKCSGSGKQLNDIKVGKKSAVASVYDICGLGFKKQVNSSFQIK